MPTDSNREIILQLLIQSGEINQKNIDEITEFHEKEVDIKGLDSMIAVWEKRSVLYKARNPQAAEYAKFYHGILKKAKKKKHTLVSGSITFPDFRIRFTFNKNKNILEDFAKCSPAAKNS